MPEMLKMWAGQKQIFVRYLKPARRHRGQERSWVEVFHVKKQEWKPQIVLNRDLELWEQSHS